MSMFNPESPDIAFARDCVINTLADINERPGAIFSVAEDQAYLADIVQANHQRNEAAAQQDAINRKAKYLASRTRRPAHRALNVIDLPTNARVAS